MANPNTAFKNMIACDSDFRIARDGTWFYQGSPIGRQSLVRLFSTILTCDENGEYWLQTPVEKCRIEVEDVPFQIIAMRVRDLEAGKTLCLKTNVNEWVAVDTQHPLELKWDAESGAEVPYVTVRNGLQAKINRPTYYELVEYALQNGTMEGGKRGIHSAGQFFALEGKIN